MLPSRAIPSRKDRSTRPHRLAASADEYIELWRGSLWVLRYPRGHHDDMSGIPAPRAHTIHRRTNWASLAAQNRYPTRTQVLSSSARRRAPTVIEEVIEREI
jgi:hypothetical protein